MNSKGYKTLHRVTNSVCLVIVTIGLFANTKHLAEADTWLELLKWLLFVVAGVMAFHTFLRLAKSGKPVWSVLDDK